MSDFNGYKELRRIEDSMALIVGAAFAADELEASINTLFRCGRITKSEAAEYRDCLWRIHGGLRGAREALVAVRYGEREVA